MTQDRPPLPPQLNRADFDSDDEYQEYLLFEESDRVVAPVSAEQQATFERITQNTVERIAGKRVSIGLRLPERDVQRMKALALRRGVPYQTLIGSILHQYLDGNLVEK